MPKLKIEIFSDIICPFCYIGKRKFEEALNDFPHKNDIEVVYKSFELSPETVTSPGVSVYENFSKKKGIPVDQAKQMLEQVTKMAAGVGLTFNYDKAVVVNTFKAHELLHFALKNNKQTEVKEILLKAYFEEGKNVDDIDYLVEVANSVGLDGEAFKKALASGELKSAVQFDLMEAQQFNISGVPFFVLDRKYGVSGAQDVSVFKQSIEAAHTEWKKNNPTPLFEMNDGPSCGPDGCF